MHTKKKRTLEAAGWRVGTVAEFLGLTEAESELIEIRHALSRALRAKRTAAQVTQVALAKQLKSSQSRVAKMEAGDPSVSIDLLLKTLFVIGCTRREVLQALR